MKPFVVDTNVPVVANRGASHATHSCILSCIAALREIQDRGVLVLDRGGRILSEYHRHLSPSGQPGVGDLFMKWVWQNQAVEERCEQVDITPVDGSEWDFEEFPRDAELDTFDRSDRKFVAVAVASQNDPEVLNAVDSDWWEHRHRLREHGVLVRFLCPQMFS